MLFKLFNTRFLGAGYGLFASQDIEPSYPLFTIPAKALLNSLTLEPLYPQSQNLSCTQIITLHLSLNRPVNHVSADVHFGPYISVLPENFDAHPFTWIWKAKHHSKPGNDLELGLLKSLPPRITQKLEQMCTTCGKDKAAIEEYMVLFYCLLFELRQPLDISAELSSRAKNIHAQLLLRRLLMGLVKWYIFEHIAWLNQLERILSNFANHALEVPTVYPQPTRGEIWNTGPSTKRKYGEDFTLLAPSTQATKPQDELYLKYGSHSNSTLFTEYGFVLARTDSEIEVVDLVEDLFEKRGAVGTWMKEVLTGEGYWGDWTLHLSPEPAHPSYRLITALRLYHCVPVEFVAECDDLERFIQEWRNVIYGVAMAVSDENERLWKITLGQICQTMILNSQKGADHIRLLREEGAMSLPAGVLFCIETLWEEENEVGKAVIKSLDNNVEF
ncbi:hypothetical protein CVT24_007942 [Panaeolus cyanescens]|uniref:SET domain-containing protein n=1 Tax=Panaeolus cyanescens TaxID=181874 RepID=A0A409WRL9_9AGAR|nr:hypothetical protein CVT24_007942 [Panaeolus cyanescens]